MSPNDALLEIYWEPENIPEWIIRAGKTYISFLTRDFRGEIKFKVRISDVIKYYKNEARNLTSGCRQLGTYIYDWRFVDYLAQLSIEYFKKVNIQELRREARRNGLEPKF